MMMMMTVSSGVVWSSCVLPWGVPPSQCRQSPTREREECELVTMSMMMCAAAQHAARVRT
jgi:hypothetical protein